MPPPHVTNQLIRDALHPLTVNSLDLLGKRASVRGWYSGTATDSEDTLLFSQLNDIGSMNEVFPLEQAQAAYDRMSGKARFRVPIGSPGSTAEIEHRLGGSGWKRHATLKRRLLNTC
jgi:hypothetical protein